MAYFSRYDLTGRILHFAEVPAAMLVIQDDDIVYGKADPETDYVLDRTIVPRPANNTVLAGTLLNGLPQPCVITINGTVYQCVDDHANLSLPPGEYRITVSAWPCLDANFTLRV